MLLLVSVSGSRNGLGNCLLLLLCFARRKGLQKGQHRSTTDKLVRLIVDEGGAGGGGGHSEDVMRFGDGADACTIFLLDETFPVVVNDY